MSKMWDGYSASNRSIGAHRLRLVARALSGAHHGKAERHYRAILERDREALEEGGRATEATLNPPDPPPSTSQAYELRFPPFNDWWAGLGLK